VPKLRRISGEDAIRRLEKLGFQRLRQRGSHVILKSIVLKVILAVGTLHGILKQAKLSAEDFMDDL